MYYYNWSSASSPTPLRGLSMDKPTHSSLSARSVSIRCNPTLQIPNFTFKSRLEWRRPTISCCSSYSTAEREAASSELPPVIQKRRRYRRLYPGEKEGITEEMRFVAMRLRNVNGKKVEPDGSDENDDVDGGSIGSVDEGVAGGGGSRRGGGETWQPTMEGFVKYLVDSKLVFDFVERIVDESDDVSYTYFRKTGLERSEGLSKDLTWFRQKDIAIPPPGNPGVAYVKYLEELAEKSPPLFLSHFYNIYFSHIAGGHVITKQVSEKLLKGRQLEFSNWGEGNAEELLKGLREKLNMLGEHWSRDEKNKCLREASKSFRYMGQIVRLIVL